jgi:hypothetical protein
MCGTLTYAVYSAYVFAGGVIQQGGRKAEEAFGQPEDDDKAAATGAAARSMLAKYQSDRHIGSGMNFFVWASILGVAACLSVYMLVFLHRFRSGFDAGCYSIFVAGEPDGGASSEQLRSWWMWISEQVHKEKQKQESATKRKENIEKLHKARQHLLSRMRQRWKKEAGDDHRQGKVVGDTRDEEGHQKSSILRSVLNMERGGHGAPARRSDKSDGAPPGRARPGTVGSVSGWRWWWWWWRLLMDCGGGGGGGGGGNDEERPVR